MFRIDNATNTASIPTPESVGVNPDGFFIKGNPGIGLAATIVTSDWANAVQEELCYPIEQAGLTLSKTDRGLLKKSIDFMIVKSAAKYAASAGTDTYTCTLSPVPLAYSTGMELNIKFGNANTTAATINVNSLGAKSIKMPDGSALVAGNIAANLNATLIYDGTNFVLKNPVVLSDVISYAVASGTDTYTATIASIASYATGSMVEVKFTNANTGAATLNVNSLGAKSIKLQDGSALIAGDIAAAYTALLVYDGTNYVLTNRATALTQYAASGGTDTYTATMVPAPSSYVTGASYFVSFGNANTGAATLNLNSLGAKSIKMPDGSTALAAGDIKAAHKCQLIYDGTNFLLLNPGSRSVAYGGTGILTATAYAVLCGGTTATGPFQSIASLGSSGYILSSNGAGALATMKTKSTLGLITQVVIQKFTASGTYTPTTGMVYCEGFVQAGGGGGGGEACANANSSVAGSGSSGGFSFGLLTAAQIGASKAITIGAGGNGGTAGNNNGSAGNDSSIGVLVVAKAGAGGNGSPTMTLNGCGAAVGTLAVAGTGDVTGRGWVGQPGLVFITGTNCISSAAPGGMWGGGIPAVNDLAGGAVAGTNSTANSGGGGSGAYAINTTSSAAGGNGGSGYIYIIEYISA